MKTILGGFLAAGFVLAAASETQAQFFFGVSTYPSGYYGPYPGYYTAYGAPALHAPAVYSVPSYYGYPAYGSSAYVAGYYPGAFGGYGTTYSYFTHVPGYSFTYYRGRLPRYYPGPYGGFGPYGYGPYGW